MVTFQNIVASIRIINIEPTDTILAYVNCQQLIRVAGDEH